MCCQLLLNIALRSQTKLALKEAGSKLGIKAVGEHSFEVALQSSVLGTLGPKSSRIVAVGGSPSTTSALGQQLFYLYHSSLTEAFQKWIARADLTFRV